MRTSFLVGTFPFIGLLMTVDLPVGSVLYLLKKRDGTLGWDMKMSVHPYLRGLPSCIYDFACLSPHGILPGRSPRRLVFNALNHPSDSH
jgi:hypothetical protein